MSVEYLGGKKSFIPDVFVAFIHATIGLWRKFAVQVDSFNGLGMFYSVIQGS